MRKVIRKLLHPQKRVVENTTEGKKQQHKNQDIEKAKFETAVYYIEEIFNKRQLSGRDIIRKTKSKFLKSRGI